MHKKVLIVGDRGFIGSSICEDSYFSQYALRFSSLNLQNDKFLFSKFLSENQPSLILFFAGKPSFFGDSYHQTKENYYINKEFQEFIFHISKQYGGAHFIYASSSAIYDYFPNLEASENNIDFDFDFRFKAQDYTRVKFEGLKLCQDNFSNSSPTSTGLIISNVFGIKEMVNDKLPKGFISQAIQRIYLAKQNRIPYIKFQGHSETTRDFLYIEDLIDGIKFIVSAPRKYPVINIGSGHQNSVNEIAKFISKCFGFRGKIIFEQKLPQIESRKSLNTKLLNNMGWQCKYSIEEAIGLQCDLYVKLMAAKKS